MTLVREMTPDDIDWAVEVLARRRAFLVPHAPVYWRPAADASERHREFLTYVITDGGGVGYRTDDGLIIAAPGRQGWTIDDAWVPADRWSDEGLALWTSTLERAGDVRFVCPVFEPERASFARDRGLVLANSWWHLEVSPNRGEAELAGATVTVVPAPPVYDPGGPIMFVSDVLDIDAVAKAPLVCDGPLVVVDQPAGSDELGAALAKANYVRHCDFYVSAS